MKLIPVSMGFSSSKLAISWAVSVRDLLTKYGSRVFIIGVENSENSKIRAKLYYVYRNLVQHDDVATMFLDDSKSYWPETIVSMRRYYEHKNLIRELDKSFKEIIC